MVVKLILILTSFFIASSNFALNSISIKKNESDLLDSQYEIVYQDKNFDFYGCTQNIIYRIGPYEVICKEHTHGFSYDSITASLLSKTHSSNGYRKSYYYLCIENTYCYRVGIKEN